MFARALSAIVDVSRPATGMYGLGEVAQISQCVYLVFMRDLLLRVAEGDRVRGRLPAPDVGEPPITEAVHWHRPEFVPAVAQGRTVRLWAHAPLAATAIAQTATGAPQVDR